MTESADLEGSSSWQHRPWSTLSVWLGCSAVGVGVVSAAMLGFLIVDLSPSDAFIPVFLVLLFVSMLLAWAGLTCAIVGAFRRERGRALIGAALGILGLLPFTVSVVVGLAAVSNL